MSPQLEVLRVKPVELRAPNFRLSKGLIDLTKGFSLTGFEGIGDVNFIVHDEDSLVHPCSECALG